MGRSMKRKRYKINKPIFIKRIITFVVVIALIIYGIKALYSNAKDVYASKQEYQSQLVQTEGYTEKSAFPNEVFGVPVYTDLVSKNSDGRPGTKRLIKYIVLHETGNFDNGANSRLHAVFLTENSDIDTSWHYTVDDKEIYHHIPDNEIAWHAGDGKGPGNMNGIGIELCVNRDGNFEKTFENATKLVAYLLKEYDLTVDDIKTHGDFVDKECPTSILRNHRINEFKNKVKTLMKRK